MELRGDIVKSMRLSKNWTQQHLADICDVNLRTVQRVENKGSASLETVMALCVAFETQREKLFEVPKPNNEPLQQATKSRLPLATFCVGLLTGLSVSLVMFFIL